MPTLKEKLEKKEVTIGSWITLGHTSVAEILLKVGFDWLVLDMEHSVITYAEMQRLIQVIALGGGTPLVRVSFNHQNEIKKAMDAGAHGVIVPMVQNKIDANQAVASVRYAPKGNRGVGLARAQGHGLYPLQNYRKWLDQESVVIVQIEHIDAVSNLEDILSVEGVDGFMVGPYDLSASLGFPGEFEHPKVQEAFKQVDAIAKKTKTVAGFHVVPPDPELVLKKITEGYQFVVYSFDALLLGKMAEAGLQRIRNGM